MAKYFDDLGYFDGSALFDDDIPFVFVLGGRGTGKTYSVTNWLCEHCDSQHKFMYMRRTQREMDFVNTGNIYEEHHPNVSINKNATLAKVMRDDECIGYHCSLVSIQGLRGFSMLDVSYILFDEFIAERGAPQRKYTGEQMLNAYETVNRNRELKGQPPVKCIFLSNTNKTENDIMAAFGFHGEVYKCMKATPIGMYQDECKKLIMINSSRISDLKRDTVLYKVNGDKNFEAMALNNNGIRHNLPIRNYPREAYEYICTLGAINVNRIYTGGYYITETNKEFEEPSERHLSRYAWIFMIPETVSASSDYAAEYFESLPHKLHW